MSYTHRQSVARGTPRPSATPAASRRPAVATELPPYRKPAHPLDQRAQDQIRALKGHSIVQVKDHSRKAGEKITETIGLIHDILNERETIIEKERKLWEKGIRVEEQQQTEERFAKLQEDVEHASKELEENMRAVIDTSMAAQRLEDSLEWLRQNAPGRLEQEFTTQQTQRSSRSQRRQTQNEDGDEDMDGYTEMSQGTTPGPTPLDGSRPALTGASEMFTTRMKHKQDEYTSISLGGRYSTNHAYIGFKRMLHDAKYKDEDRPLPHPDTWFTATGSPAPGVTGRGADNDGDDDIVMDRATVSMRCPITLQRFVDPWTSTKCPHSYEKNAILEMIRKSGARSGDQRVAACPVSGCDQMLTSKDIHKDPILARKIQRMREAEEREAEGSEDEGIEAEVSQTRGKSTAPQIKSDPSSSLRIPASQQPPKSSIVEDLGASDEDEDDDE